MQYAPWATLREYGLEGRFEHDCRKLAGIADQAARESITFDYEINPASGLTRSQYVID